MSKKRETVDVELRLPRETLAVIDALAKQGILGETREEVTLYILRTFMFERIRAFLKQSK